MKPTYKEFGKYLRAVADLYAQYGDAPLELEKEYDKLHHQLCQMHNDFEHGAFRVENLKDVFVLHSRATDKDGFRLKERNRTRLPK